MGSSMPTIPKPTTCELWRRTYQPEIASPVHGLSPDPLLLPAPASSQSGSRISNPSKWRTFGVSRKQRRSEGFVLGDEMSGIVTPSGDVEDLGAPLVVTATKQAEDLPQLPVVLQSCQRMPKAATNGIDASEKSS